MSADEAAHRALSGGGSATGRVEELLTVMSEQAAAVALLREKWAESVRAVPPAPDDGGSDGASSWSLTDPRRRLWFRAEGVREMRFSNYALWVGWWVDTAQLALRSAVGEPDPELREATADGSSEAAQGPERGKSDPPRLVQRARLRRWGENWINDSLPWLLPRDDLDRLLALTGDTSSARAVRLAHRSVLDARHAGDLALEQEESGSAATCEVNRNWNLYGRRHPLVCEYARAIADHLAKWTSARP
ncbi:hypothetical protein [Saccharopolyspora gloriosae]|uniref:Uncharacterized protein n=1 Tax=Saccharopolyspora gloriosae TaxID=455344 RepID=A0A840NCQ6_9PSEU|nr:hypothetical protein [Saccharopolyspora gloriosae]MBB5067998.1 hypothetical protein [Saccharopolyspora gloriosae]